MLQYIFSQNSESLVFTKILMFYFFFFKENTYSDSNDVGLWIHFKNPKHVLSKWVVFLFLIAQDIRQESACQVPDSAGICSLHVLSQFRCPWHSSWPWWVEYSFDFRCELLCLMPQCGWEGFHACSQMMTVPQAAVLRWMWAALSGRKVFCVTFSLLGRRDSITEWQSIFSPFRGQC